MNRESIERNYTRGLWGVQELKIAIKKGIISVDDFVEITNKSADELIDSIDNIKAQKLNELSAICNETIYSGIDVETTEGIEHFSLEIEDQINISAQATAVRNGAIEVPYHADDKGCRMFSVEEMLAVEAHAYMYKTFNTTYFNKLKTWVLRCETVEEINSILYGSELPDDLDAELVTLTGYSSKIE